MKCERLVIRRGRVRRCCRQGERYVYKGRVHHWCIDHAPKEAWWVPPHVPEGEELRYAPPEAF